MNGFMKEQKFRNRGFYIKRLLFVFIINEGRKSNHKNITLAISILFENLFHKENVRENWIFGVRLDTFRVTIKIKFMGPKKYV